MPNLEAYKRILGLTGNTVGQVNKIQSDIILEQTWWNDIQSRVCYIYDYFHDSEKDLNKNLDSANDELKFAVDAKFIVTKYGSVEDDQVEYLLQFRPSQNCPLEYYSTDFEKRYNAEFPVGLYVDIPDDKGIYRRWLICSTEYGNQFINYKILPCNYNFRWVLNNTKYQMWGIAKLSNSSGSGISVNSVTTSVEDKDQIWFPMNSISEKLFYNQRIILSALVSEPTVWRITKIKNIYPLGINKLTLLQSEFNPENDYVNLDTGEMYADYNKSSVAPNDWNSESIPITNYCKLSCFSQVIKVGGDYKKINANIFDSENLDITTEYIQNFNLECWNFKINNIDASNLVEVLPTESPNNIKVKFVGNDSYLTSILTVSCEVNGYADEIQLEILGL